MPDEDQPKNPFVRWRRHVDQHIGAGLNSVLGIPSMLSPAQPLPSTLQSENPTTDSSVSDQVQQIRRIHCPHVHEPTNMHSFPFNMAAKAALRDLSSIIHSSTYSPLTLDQHLPPPVPRGVPDDIDLDPESDFTYRDAYEDLLRVSTGLALTPFSTFAARKSPAYWMYGLDGGESPFQWLGRISSDGLVRRVLEQAAQQPFVAEEYRELDQEDREEPFSALAKSWMGTGNPFRSESRNAFKRDAPADRDEAEDELPRSLFTELSRAVRMMERVFDEAAEKQPKLTGPKDETQEKPRKMADTEAEMYEMLQEVFSGGGSLSALMRAAMDVSAELRAQTATSWASESTTGQGVNDTTGVRTVRTTEKYIDEDGTHHVKVVLRRLNAAGEEISHETHHAIRYGPGSRGVVEDVDDTKVGREGSYQSTGKETKKSSNGSSNSGWFWK